MKRIAFIMAIVAFVAMANGATGQEKKSSTVWFKSNMHCAACEKSLFDHLRFEKGVKDLKVDHVSNTVKVVYDPRKSSGESLAKAIEKKGYTAGKITSEEYDRMLQSGDSKEASQEEHKH